MPDADHPFQAKTVWSAEEFNAYLSVDASPSREDDTFVLELQPSGAWRPATDDELDTWLNKHIRSQNAGG